MSITWASEQGCNGSPFQRKGIELTMNRRTFLTTAGAAMVATAGCLGENQGGEATDEMESTTDGPDSTTGEPTDAMTASSDGNALSGHPTAANIADQPVLGPDPLTAPAIIISFSDPSCPSCARFESNTVPEIESNLAEEGKAAYVYRNMPIIYPWGKPAVQTLEATFAHDPEAFWTLKDYYYGSQGSFDTDNVFERTRTFLADSTDVDAEAVVSEAEARKHDDAVQADLTAGNEGGVSSTPTSFLFKNGEHVTTITGPRSYTVFEEALGV